MRARSARTDLVRSEKLSFPVVVNLTHASSKPPMALPDHVAHLPSGIAGLLLVVRPGSGGACQPASLGLLQLVVAALDDLKTV